MDPRSKTSCLRAHIERQDWYCMNEIPSGRWTCSVMLRWLLGQSLLQALTDKRVYHISDIWTWMSCRGLKLSVFNTELVLSPKSSPPLYLSCYCRKQYPPLSPSSSQPRSHLSLIPHIRSVVKTFVTSLRYTLFSPLTLPPLSCQLLSPHAWITAIACWWAYLLLVSPHSSPSSIQLVKWFS